MHRIRRSAVVLAGLAIALLALGAAAPAALASLPRDPIRTAVVQAPPAQMHTVVTGGMPGWQITLIAIGAALFAAAAAAVLADRARAARRRVTVAI
ncbi:MAG TPA: hypothetical protein VGM53_29475 [Streptosporangiaceae bacterium]